MSSKKICKGFTASGKPCTVIPIKHSFNKDTGKKYDTNFCQMHQPGKISKACKCPHCGYHRGLELKQEIEIAPKKPVKSLTYKNTKLKLTSEQRNELLRKKKEGDTNYMLKLTNSQKRKLAGTI